LGYQSLCQEVADSIGWRRFCRIPLDRPVPHTTTLVKLVGRAGPEVIGQLNQALLGKLVAGKLLRGRKLRVDTTVVAATAPTAYPTTTRSPRPLTTCLLQGQVASSHRASTRACDGWPWDEAPAGWSTRRVLPQPLVAC
jgi:Transposase domain (DUF772)